MTLCKAGQSHSKRLTGELRRHAYQPRLCGELRQSCKWNQTVLIPRAHGIGSCPKTVGRGKSRKFRSMTQIFKPGGNRMSMWNFKAPNWVNSAHTRLRARQSHAAEPEAAGTLEMDELFTFVGSKKSLPTLSRSSSGRRAASSRTKSAGSARRK